MRILVVDDSRVMRSIVKRSLAGVDRVAHATFIEAADGQEGLEAARAERPSLVLSDWNMPRMSGVEFLRALRAEGDEVPFGFVTSESTPQMLEVALASGADFLVSKPFTPETIGLAVTAALT